MARSTLNLWTALASVTGAVVLVCLGHVLSGMLWLLASLVWAGMAVWSLAHDDSGSVPSPWKRVARRLFRMAAFLSLC